MNLGRIGRTVMSGGDSSGSAACFPPSADPNGRAGCCSLL
jgi:hypothetical protein